MSKSSAFGFSASWYSLLLCPYISKFCRNIKHKAMLMRGDLDLDSMQAYTGCLNDVLRKTMLNQEVMFKNQVQELHHLYGIQKTLMQNLGENDFDRCDFRKASAQSNLFPCANSTRDEPAGLLEGCKGIYDKIQLRTSGLKLPSDECVNHIDSTELKLSLSIREDNWREGGTKRTWFDVETPSCSQYVIDLEESVERTSNEGLEQSPSFSSAAPITNLGGKHDLTVPVLFYPTISTCVDKNPLSWPAESNPIVDYSEWNPFDQGLKKGSGGISNYNTSARRQLFSSYEAGLLDLNKIQHDDDSSCLSNDPTVVHPSTTSSSHGFCGLVGGKVEEGILCFATGKKENNNGSNETSETVQKGAVGNFAFMNSNRRNARTEYLAGKTKVDGLNIGEMGHVSLEAVSRSNIDLLEEVGYHNNNTSTGNDGFILKLLNGRNHSFAAAKQVNYENKKAEDPVISYSDHSQKTDRVGYGNISSPSFMPCCTGDNDSSSIKTIQSEVESRNSNPFSADQFSGTREGSQVSETLMCEQDQRSSDSSELKQKHLNKEGESTELDALIREAAEALVGITLESASGYRDCAYTAGGSNKMEAKESEQPQCSSDSFELNTLKLTESNADDYCVSSKPSEVNYTDSKDFGCKLRRGRRLKDFQKDILPGLSTLSRHEIREDINIMEAVLRSREYKRLKARMADGNGWCAPVRNKRSRLNYVPRWRKTL